MMKVIISSLFQVVCFPFEDQIVTIDQLSFDNSSSSTPSGHTVPAIDNSQSTTENVGIIIYLSLMGNFNILAQIIAISSTPGGGSSPLSSIDTS